MQEKLRTENLEIEGLLQHPNTNALDKLNEADTYLCSRNRGRIHPANIKNIGKLVHPSSTCYSPKERFSVDSCYKVLDFYNRVFVLFPWTNDKKSIEVYKTIENNIAENNIDTIIDTLTRKMNEY